MIRRKIGALLFASVLSSAVYADVRPTTVDCVVRPVYGYRADGTPGRIVKLKLKGTELNGELKIDVVAKGAKESNRFTIAAQDSTELELMLPSILPTEATTGAALEGMKRAMRSPRSELETPRRRKPSASER